MMLKLLALFVVAAVTVVLADPTMYKKNDLNLYEAGELTWNDVHFRVARPPTHANRAQQTLIGDVITRTKLANFFFT